ncbi:hypothetical protein DFH06DRAFT_1383026 [Mycena polygramma]|nr:hypothetical protein DFH06DRAFT_1383026 [Mycena polygramma]
MGKLVPRLLESVGYRGARIALRCCLLIQIELYATTTEWLISYVLDADEASEEHDLWTARQTQQGAPVRGLHAQRTRYVMSQDNTDVRRDGAGMPQRARGRHGYSARGGYREVHGPVLGLCGTSAGHAQCPRRRARRGAVTGGDYAALRTVRWCSDSDGARARHTQRARCPVVCTAIDIMRLRARHARAAAPCGACARMVSSYREEYLESAMRRSDGLENDTHPHA